MALGVSEPQRHPPRATPYQPAVDTEVLAQLLDVTDQVVGRIGREVGPHVGGRWRALSTVTLVELHQAVCLRMEGAAAPR